MDNSFDYKLLYEILDALSIPIIIVDREGKIFFFNRGAERFLGYKKEEILSQHISLLVPPAFKLVFKGVYSKIINNPEESPRVGENVFPILKKTGEVVSVQIVSSYIYLQDKGLFAVSVFGTHERNNLDALWLKALVEQANVAIEITDLAGNIIYVNPEFEKASGYTKEELLGKNPRILKSGKHSEEFYKHLWETISSGRVWKGIFINRRKDGSICYVDGVVFPIKDEYGEIIGYGSIRTDITEKIQIEEEMKKRTQKLIELQGLLIKMASKKLSSEYTLTDFVKEILEKATELIEADKALVIMFNEDYTELKPIDVYFKKNRRHVEGFITYEKDLPLYFKKIKDGREEFLIINDRHNKDIKEELNRFAKRYDVKELGESLIDIPIRSNQGIIGVLTFATFDPSKDWSLDEQIFAKYIADILSLKIEQDIRLKMEKALIKAKEDAEAANKAKTRFLSQMSHELRTPLNAILGFSQLLYEEMLGPLNEAQRDAIKDILSSGQHLLDLINEILDLSKIESGRITLSIESVNLAQIISEVVDLSKPLAAKRDIKIINNIDGEVYVKGDYTRLRQVFINLISNAIKYNKDSGYVKITGNASDGLFKVNIKDSGIGIPKNKISRLFEPFERLGREGTSFEGTGIGLTITKRLIELMGGTIEVKSLVGMGSTFTISLVRAEKNPVKEIEDELISEEISNKIFKRARKYKVLYIEDNISNLKLVTKILLKRPEVELITSGQGRVGIDLAISHKPHIILVDINLPDISGYDVLERLREIRDLEDTPIIAISADVFGMDKDKAKKKGFDDFISKPINVKQFLNVIDKYLADADDF